MTMRAKEPINGDRRLTRAERETHRQKNNGFDNFRVAWKEWRKGIRVRWNLTADAFIYLKAGVTEKEILRDREKEFYSIISSPG